MAKKQAAAKKTKKTAAKSGAKSTNLVRRVTIEKHPQSQFPEFRTGDTINVYVRVREGEKERVQLYRGLVIKMQGSGMGRSFTVRKISSGIGVERTFPYRSPAIDRVELVSTGNVRRAKLMYLRQLKGKAASIEAEMAQAIEGDVLDESAIAATVEAAPPATTSES